jgi:hypothetical protein
MNDCISNPPIEGIPARELNEAPLEFPFRFMREYALKPGLWI